ncbi:hypothetical protein ACPPVO_57395 [Dactylosporangium sp. McL0621]|uniref:hypothetical protein n=1 Tax=Dactylosporangium sp. McL0621 TaxID=3415678 RepID=UPI003CE9B413
MAAGRSCGVRWTAQSARTIVESDPAATEADVQLRALQSDRFDEIARTLIGGILLAYSGLAILAKGVHNGILKGFE